MSYITAIGTAVPENCFSQMKIAEFMAKALELDETEKRKLWALYRTTQIAQRYSVLADYGKDSVAEYEFYPQSTNLEPFPTVSQRMEAYRAYALPLCLKAVENLNLTGVTHLITVSCTGMYAPGLDIDLIEQLSLDTTIHRTAINFMGCYGAFNGLKVANDICLAHPTAKVLLVTVELCTLHFQKKKDIDFLLSNALFADGAAAVIIENTTSKSPKAFRMASFFCDLYQDGKSDMAWTIADFGFEMPLTSYIPKLVKKGIKSLVERLLNQSNHALNEIDYFAVHPGGKAILEAIETALDITVFDNRYAYKILQEYGNMSSCTVLFVLDAIMKDIKGTDTHKKILSCAFGPGLTLESMLLEIEA